METALTFLLYAGAAYLLIPVAIVSFIIFIFLLVAFFGNRR